MLTLAAATYIPAVDWVILALWLGYCVALTSGLINKNHDAKVIAAILFVLTVIIGTASVGTG